MSSRVGIFLHFFNHILRMSRNYNACVRARKDVKLVSSTYALCKVVLSRSRKCTVTVRVCVQKINGYHL